jgi:predicted acetyltransferase
VTGSTSLLLVSSGQHVVVQRLWQLYAHDLSEYRGSMPQADGLFGPGRLPLYLADDDRWGYLIVRGPEPAGFALVRGLSGDVRVLGEFFVVRAARRLGVGFSAATAVLGRHPGRWEIAFQDEANPAAGRLWRRLASHLDTAGWSEERRPVPGSPHLPPDTWVSLTVAEPT